MSLAGNLKKFRQKAGLSLTETAAKALVPAGYLKRLESGEDYNPMIDHGFLEKIHRVAVALDTTIADLLDLPVRVKLKGGDR